MTPWVLRLIIANVVVFFLSRAFPLIGQYGMLVPAYVLQHPWTLVTYMFLHAGFLHIFFNMIVLFFFGPRVEARLGGRDFLWLYFLSGMGGAGASFIFAPNAAVVGASAAIFGVMLAYAMYWPNAQVWIWGVLPVRAIWLVGGFVALSLFFGVTGAEPGIAHFAHLGGLATGWLYLRWHDRKLRRAKRPPGPTTLERVSGKLQREEKRWRAIDLEQLHELNRAEVERLLRKIDVYGVDGLTTDERDFMNRMAS